MRRQRFAPAFFVLILMFFLICGYVVYAYRQVKPGEGRICEGVYVGAVNISGMTEEEAVTALSDYGAELAKCEIIVDVNGSKVSTQMSDLDFSYHGTEAVKEAVKLGKEGNLFENYAQLKQIAAEHKVYDISTSFSQKKLKKFVKNECGKKCNSAQNATIKMKNGTLVYAEAKQGVSLDVSATTDAIKEALEQNADAKTVEVKAVVQVQEPTVNKELASRCKDKIGEFSTSFNAGNVSRSKNVANAARLINGSVVYPGETFSVHDTISPMTEDNGYYAAPSYSNGQVVDSIGGGVCQVSTTLYNAVLRAELEVVERSPHSMVVTYVKPSMDAAIAGDYKDFKFRNNTQVPIYIQAGTDSGIIFFRIYGEETRDSNRTVEFESEVTETIEPGADKITYDKTKPESYMEVTQEAHTGYKAVLWKIVTENGKTKKTQINSSTYKAEPRYVTKGAAKSTPTPAPSATPKAKATATPKTATSTPKAKKKSEAAVTLAPTATPAPAANEPVTE